MTRKKTHKSESGISEVRAIEIGENFDPIPSDFNVTKISEARGNKFYAGLAGSLWHFVWASVAADDTGCIFHHSISQAFIPRFLFAEELKKQINFVGMMRDEVVSPDNVLASSGIWGEFSVGVTKDSHVFLVQGEKAYPLGDASDWARNDLNILERAQSEVVSKNDRFYLPTGSTHGGRPICFSSQKLVEAIAFECQVYGTLDPVNTFELFSAFCTLVDSPLSRNFDQDYIDILLNEQLSFSAENAPGELEDLFTALQDAMFDGRQIWGRAATCLDEAMPFVVNGLKKLSDVQRCQLVLMRDLYSLLPFISLAVIVGMSDFDKCADLLCEGLQPDSEQEQSIRRQLTFIKLLGLLCHNRD